VSEAWKARVRIDALPKLPNRSLYTQWLAKKRDKDLWHQLVGAAFAGRKPPRPLACADLILMRHSVAPPDRDNLMASWKYVIDGLVVCGVLAGDTPEIIGTPHSGHAKRSHGKGWIEVYVQERSVPHEAVAMPAWAEKISSRP
jgi:hypothetical protein